MNGALGRHLVHHVQARPQFLIRAAANEGSEVADKARKRLALPTGRDNLLQHPMWAELAASGILPARELRRLENQLRHSGTWPDREDHSAFLKTYERARGEIDAFVDAVYAHFDQEPAH
ncbi:hypothetical protein AB0911_38470 [Streptomyces nigra]|uniref:hypothetical protein n=1 Tax=Streptomyces nigra TaxID=1827580 RepID=UPI00345698EE